MKPMYDDKSCEDDENCGDNSNQDNEYEGTTTKLTNSNATEEDNSKKDDQDIGDNKTEYEGYEGDDNKDDDYDLQKMSTATRILTIAKMTDTK
jgi:hypothetical protein